MSLQSSDKEPYYSARIHGYIDPLRRLEVLIPGGYANKAEYDKAWKRRAKQYVCTSEGCGLVWHGPGNHSSAKTHAEISGHRIIRGNPEGKHRMMEWEK